MQTHYQINNAEFAALVNAGISTETLFYSVPKFGHVGGAMGLCYYMDNHKNMKSKIFQAILNSLPADEQLAMYEYFEFVKGESEPEPERLGIAYFNRSQDKKLISQESMEEEIIEPAKKKLWFAKG